MKINGMGGFLMGCLGTSLVAGVLVLAAWPNPHTPYPQILPNKTTLQVIVHGERWNIMIGQNDVELKFMDALAITSCELHQIWISSGLDYSIQQETVFHELLHAHTCDETNEAHNDYYNSKEYGTHPAFDKIASVTTTLIHDNPELAKYFLGETK
jgi:hypothetical protein